MSTIRGDMLAEPDSAIGGDTSIAGIPDGGRWIRCPTCHRPTPWLNNSQRPFCSLTCRLVDLGVWLDEGYAMPGDSPEHVR
jgi:endogenous inhibitor of DNA gyrase (YacG/DUF329 family)